MYYDPFYEAEMLNTFGQIYYETKEYVKAKEYFTIIKELDPNNKKQIDFFKSPAGK